MSRNLGFRSRAVCAPRACGAYATRCIVHPHSAACRLRATDRRVWVTGLNPAAGNIGGGEGAAAGRRMKRTAVSRSGGCQAGGGGNAINGLTASSNSSS